MFVKLLSATAFCMTAGIALADGHANAEDGAKVFKKRCASCHVVIDDAGVKIAGRSAKAGPNLYDVVGSTAGAVEGFRYSKSLKAANAAELIWTEENFAAWSKDPSKFLKTFLDDSKARSKMSFKLSKAQEAADLYAFLSTVGARP